MPALDEEKSAFTHNDEVPAGSKPVRRNSIIHYLAYLLLCIPLLVTFIPELRNLVTIRCKQYWSDRTVNYMQQAYDLLEKHPLIDSHVDLPILIRWLYHNDIYSENFTEPFEHGGMIGHVDLPRLDAGRYGGVFWSLYYGCPKDAFDFSDEIYYPIVKATLEAVDLHHRLAGKYPHYFTPPSTAAAALKAFHSPNRTLISPGAIEGLHQIGNSLSTLRLYYDLGVRYATLTHNCHNAYADAAIVGYPDSVASTPYWGGLSKKGRVLVREMNRMGMIVDISHVSQDTMREVLSGKHNDDAPHSEYSLDREETEWSGSIAPPFFSHSSVYAICPHPRNVPDDVLQLVKQRGAVVMINIAPDFISCVASNSSNGLPEFYPTNSTLEQVAKHIMYVGDLIGYDHVGLGTDFDGILNVPKGLEDVSKMPDLVAHLLSHGVSEKDVIQVAGGNVMRVWSEVDKVAMRMQAEGVLPAEDEVSMG